MRLRGLWFVLAFVGTSALAQDRGFAAHRFDASAVGSRLFLLERPWYSSTRYFAAGVSVDYSQAPLVPRVATGRGGITPIIENALRGHVDLAGSFLDRVLISASLPVTFLETGTPEIVSATGPLSGVGLGDPRVGLNVRLFGDAEQDAFSLHLGADVWIPIGGAPRHQGDLGVRVLPRIVAAGAGGVVRWTVEGSFLLRPYSSIGPPALGMTAAPEARLGGALHFSFFEDRLSLGPEVKFSSQVIGANAFSVNGMSLELLAGGNFFIADQIFVGLAGGTGLLGAAGTPDLRGIVRVAWAPRKGETTGGPVVLPRSIADDADEDGVRDADDRCPFEPESKNGLRDGDGCPEFEGDAGVGASPPLARILSSLTPTLSPRERGDPSSSSPPASSSIAAVDAGSNAFFTTDSDGDAIFDESDRCPVTPEDHDGFEDDDGCPEDDNDFDGVADVDDTCSLEAETRNGLSDVDGCPDVAPDADGDLVADAVDRCPLEPENIDGLRDEDGCPEYAANTAASSASSAVIASQVALARILAPPPPRVAEAIGARLDADKDAIDDEADRCPITPEDGDGFEDEDGCPELDQDEDGIPDKADKCPLDAETFNGWKDDDGCSDEHGDVDSDGIEFALDRCPLEPGDGAADGCPHLPPPKLAIVGFVPVKPNEAPVAVPPAPGDFDKDGVNDDSDPCPMTAEDKDGFADEDGCPEPDNDADGIEDKKDKCPFEAETVNGIRDDDGCPDTGTGSVHIRARELVLDETVQFKTGSATLQPASNKVLKQVASVLKGARFISLDIQGHTDDVGSAANNIKLSQKRAEAIRTFLVKAGIAPGRLVAHGFGPTRPRASNATAAGREQNRRVDFLIIGEAK